MRPSSNTEARIVMLLSDGPKTSEEIWEHPKIKRNHSVKGINKHCRAMSQVKKCGERVVIYPHSGLKHVNVWELVK